MKQSSEYLLPALLTMGGDSGADALPLRLRETAVCQDRVRQPCPGLGMRNTVEVLLPPPDVVKQGGCVEQGAVHAVPLPYIIEVCQPGNREQVLQSVAAEGTLPLQFLNLSQRSPEGRVPENAVHAVHGVLPCLNVSAHF
jgi:hypothetical protein